MKKLIPFLLAGAATFGAGGVAIAAANAVSTTPAPAHVPEFRPAAATANLSSSTSDDPANHDANDINDDNGVDDPANHDANDINDDNSVDDPANHDANDINDDNGVDN